MNFKNLRTSILFGSYVGLLGTLLSFFINLAFYYAPYIVLPGNPITTALVYAAGVILAYLSTDAMIHRWQTSRRNRIIAAAGILAVLLMGYVVYFFH